MNNDKKVLTSSTRKKYAVVPSASRTLLNRDELRRIDRAMDTTDISANHRPQHLPSSTIPSLPFDRINTNGDDVLGLAVCPVGENESALNVPLRFVAPEEFNLPDLQDPPSSLTLARRLGALMKGAESVTTTWTRRPAVRKEDTTTKISALSDAETRAQSALRAGQADRAARLFCLVGCLHYNSANMELALGGFEKALECFERAQQPRGAALCHNMLGVCNYHLGRYKTSLVHHKQQETLGGAYAAAVAQTNMGVCYAALGDLEFAVQAFEDALESAKASREIMLETIGEGNLGLISLKIRNMRAAQAHLELCLEHCSAAGDKSGACICLLLLGEVYAIMNDYQHALFYYEHAYRIGGEASNPDVVSIARVCIGVTRGNAHIRDTIVQHAAQMGQEVEVSNVVNLLPS
ncbi:hypothetical protein AGDE_03208 [Angomonas deanei]|uniref:Tetratricopeptide repeat, putative n=1 Tax=Angomonas deanei TaxID=59799 RepID=S9VIS0_9TRYP|nr:hypothetical protein AGDE_04789 [Angomonas deanei]EPY40719.1 hypothetical protein AGDE_03208 [Angomonas deanei]CAD2217664.1 Tetratricopeptide repeat, putative [Angomonas deanei]|eukprot:EPY39140.1 hypothetical protein AGDE_04789 [Angomonas deanei]